MFNYLDEEKLNIDPKDPIRDKLTYICHEFRIPGEIILYRKMKGGHINTAYYVALYDGAEVRQYVAQCLNWYVFKDPVSVMHNIDLITNYILAQDPNAERRRRMHFRHTAQGHNFVILPEEDGREFWRVYNYVNGAVAFESANGNPEVLRMSGVAFGRFLKQLKDFDATQLKESIPHFHDTRYRLQKFLTHVEEDSCGRAQECAGEIELIRHYADFACILNQMLDRGELPLRVTHNDTKTNNVLLDKDTLDPLCVIDLDTCMPGLVCHDFGDTVRFAANAASEDEPDVEKAKLDLDMFQAYAEGYLSETKDILTDAEKHSLVLGALTITLEQGIRFLDDYLCGDKYYRIKYPAHNLVRARAQLYFFMDMMAHQKEMEEIVSRLALA